VDQNRIFLASSSRENELLLDHKRDTGVGNLAQFERIGFFSIFIVNKDEFQSYVQGLTDELKSTIEQKITFHRLKSTIDL